MQPHTSIRAISVKQPWAELIVRFGPENKDYENRSQRFSFKGPVLIHASRMPVTNWRLVLDDVKKLKGLIVNQNAPCGALIGITTFDGCVHEDEIDREAAANFWFMGPYGIKLKNSKPFSKAIPWKGALGLFAVPLIGLVAEEINKLDDYRFVLEKKENPV